MITDGQCYERDNFVPRSNSSSAVMGEANTDHSMLCVLCTTVCHEAELCQQSQLFLAGVV